MVVFGCECLNVRNDVRIIRRQPIQRGRSHHRPGRDIAGAAPFAGRFALYSMPPLPAPTRKRCRRSRCNGG